MEDSKSVLSSGAYGIPKWILKKGMRYERDDFIVSPPTLDDGGFLRLRYGPSEPSLQGASQEGGMTVEVKDDTLQFSSDPSPTTTISIGPGGFSVDSTPTTTPLTTPETKQENQEVHPLLVLPFKFGGASATIKEETSKSVENIPAYVNSNDSSLLEKVSMLSVSSNFSDKVLSPVTSPFTTPRTSPTLHRKVRATMDPPRKISAHSYFCTKEYRENLMTVSENFKQDAATSSQPKQVDEVNIPAHAIDPKMMGQRRRKPKPSALREMNFWAPTSM